MDKIPYFGPSAWAAVLNEIRQRAGEYDRSGDWPEQDIKALTAAGAMRWAISTEFGGDGLSALDLHLRYEELASASLCDALILTQRDSAVGLVESSPNFSKQRKMLKRFVEGSHFTTVGFAQLTTSHQHGKPALIAEPTNEGFLLNGIIPWCTGAAIAPFIGQKTMSATVGRNRDDRTRSGTNGGKSGEHEVSLQTAIAVIKELDLGKYDVVPFYITKQGEWRSGPQLAGPADSDNLALGLSRG